jgi:hypothetical protein
MMRAWLLAAFALCVSALSPAGYALAAAPAYVACAEHLQSPDPMWTSIANRICKSFRDAAAAAPIRGTPEGKAAFHQLYIDTFNVAEMVKHVTPQCIRQWGKYTQKQIRRIVEKEVFERIASFVLQRPSDFSSDQKAGFLIGPLGKRQGELQTKVVMSGQSDVDITWNYVCEGNDCEVVDITVLSASLSDQIKQSLQSRCHR